MTPARPARCLACSIFRREIGALQASGRLDLDVTFLSSMLHMHPERLEARLEQSLATVQAEDPESEVVLAFGDCCARMADFESGPGIRRTEGLNCCEILLGPETYRRLRREGAFFLLPEWALAWKKIFVEQLGLMGPCAREFMREMHTRLVYLDTGLAPVPEGELEEASAFLGLPVEIRPAPLGPLLASLQAAAESARSHGGA
jgi:hypothetical protein